MMLFSRPFCVSRLFPALFFKNYYYCYFFFFLCLCYGELLPCLAKLDLHFLFFSFLFKPIQEFLLLYMVDIFSSMKTKGIEMRSHLLVDLAKLISNPWKLGQTADVCVFWPTRPMTGEIKRSLNKPATNMHVYFSWWIFLFFFFHCLCLLNKKGKKKIS